MASTRASFLAQPYGAYYHREVPEPDPELTRVGPGSPCGEYLRRFWQPVVTTEELGDLPKRIRIMGEDLVAFRDRRGRLGLLELHCPHRGTSLEFGLVGESGIRCCYHGWLYDVNGKILETPGEPEDSTLKDRLCHGAYPVREYGGMMFAYMGPPDKIPAFPMYDTFDRPGWRSWIGSSYSLPCNWLQVKENAMDPAHLAFLHSTVSGAQVGDTIAADFEQQSEWDFMETPIGMVYIDSRRTGDKVWIRMSDFMPPNLHQFPSSGVLQRMGGFYGRPETAIWAVPVDDTNTRTFWMWHVQEGAELPKDYSGFGQSGDRPYEEQQRHPGDYDAQVSQRPIAIHGLEHLTVTDRGVIMLRNLLRSGIKAVQQGEDPPGIYREEGTRVLTYASDTVVEVPPAPTPEEDRRLIRETGRKVAEGYLKTPPALAGIT